MVSLLDYIIENKTNETPFVSKFYMANVGKENNYEYDKESIGDVIDPSALQFNLTTTLGAKWEMLDADSQYYKIDLRRNGAGNIHSYISDVKTFDFVVYVGTTALKASDIPDFIMSFEPIE